MQIISVEQIPEEMFQDATVPCAPWLKNYLLEETSDYLLFVADDGLIDFVVGALPCSYVGYTCTLWGMQMQKRTVDFAHLRGYRYIFEQMLQAAESAGTMFRAEAACEDRASNKMLRFAGFEKTLELPDRNVYERN